jgi:hypothetical protein
MASTAPSPQGMAPESRGAGMAPRRVAAVVWAIMMVMPLLFLGAVLAVEDASAPAPSGLLLALTIATSALGIALSRIVPPRIPASQTGGRPAANAFTRLLLAWGLCEGVAVFPLVAHLLVHDLRLLVVFAADVIALALLYPSENAWAQLAAEQAYRRQGRTDR